jgi:hypothetical protein
MVVGVVVLQQQQTKWWIPRSLNNQLLKGLNIFLVKKRNNPDSPDFTICLIFSCISWMTFSAMVGMIDEMKSGLLRVAQTTSES